MSLVVPHPSNRCAVLFLKEIEEQPHRLVHRRVYAPVALQALPDMIHAFGFSEGEKVVRGYVERLAQRVDVLNTKAFGQPALEVRDVLVGHVHRLRQFGLLELRGKAELVDASSKGFRLQPHRPDSAMLQPGDTFGIMRLGPCDLGRYWLCDLKLS